MVLRKSTVLFLTVGVTFLISGITALSVSNLSKSCLQCICIAASQCILDINGSYGYQGPFWISKIYWADAGNITLPNDDPVRDFAYIDCARSYACAEATVIGYMKRFAKDCNQDGVIDCDDYVRLHVTGSPCASLESFLRTEQYRRYTYCRKTALRSNPLL